jgi:hypothetical protein
MLHYCPAEPPQIALVCRLVRLLRPQRGIALGNLSEAADGEVKLDNQRLFGPQRAVIVEDGNTGGRFDVIGAALLCDSPDEIGDCGLRRAVIPTRQLRIHVSRWRRADSASRQLDRC